ncbi:hypothetical protein J4226_05170 [Candidatus Pacearchaeota archaeon]|nr:hypothetical protein [Candidatus Pacearchaeota archaeon]
MLEELPILFTTEENLILTLAFFTTVIILYSIFVFYFYRFLAKKNIIELNLNQYNQYENPALIKIFAGVFYIIEYIILLPVLTFFWFGVLAILTLLLAKGIAVKTILLIAAALVTSIRVTSFVSEDLAKDLAKMVPFTLLAIAISTAGFFEIPLFFYRISEIPSLFSNVPYYLLFIVIIELIMRIAEFVQATLKPSNTTENETLFEEETE